MSTMCCAAKPGKRWYGGSPMAPGSSLNLQQFTPDGKSLIGRQSGVGEKSGIFRLQPDLPGAQPELILRDTNETGVARVTPDGRWLVLFLADGEVANASSPWLSLVAYRVKPIRPAPSASANGQHSSR